MSYTKTFSGKVYTFKFKFTGMLNIIFGYKLWNMMVFSS